MSCEGTREIYTPIPKGSLQGCTESYSTFDPLYSPYPQGGILDTTSSQEPRYEKELEALIGQEDTIRYIFEEKEDIIRSIHYNYWRENFQFEYHRRDVSQLSPDKEGTKNYIIRTYIPEFAVESGFLSINITGSFSKCVLSELKELQEKRRGVIIRIHELWIRYFELQAQLQEGEEQMIHNFSTYFGGILRTKTHKIGRASCRERV